MASPGNVLIFDIWRDIKRHLVVYVLLLLVLVSAFSVIFFTHLNRQTTSELEVLLTDRDELDIEWRNLLLEQNALAEHSRIETQAQRLLEMSRPDAESEVVIRLP